MTVDQDPFATVLEKMQPEVRALAEEVRALIREVVPAVKEKAQPGWGVINFDHQGALASIMGAKGWASVGFVRGVELDDPTGLLEGAGKGMRHLKVRTGRPFPREALRAFIRQAAALNERLGPTPGVGRRWGGGAP